VVSALHRVVQPNVMAGTARRLRAVAAQVAERKVVAAYDWMAKSHRRSSASQPQMMGVPVLGLVSCQMHSQLFRSDLFQLQRKWLLPANGE
jgi:hypothetical protein